MGKFPQFSVVPHSAPYRHQIIVVQCNSVPHMPHKMHMFDNEKSITTEPVRVAGRQGGYVPPKTAAYI